MSDRLIKATFRAMLPRTEEVPGMEDIDLDGYVRQFRADVPRTMWLGVVLGSAVYQAAPIVTIGVPLPAAMLPKRMAEKYASQVVRHPSYLIRQATFLVKTMAGLGWGRDPKVREHFGMKPYSADPGSWRQS